MNNYNKIIRGLKIIIKNILSIKKKKTKNKIKK